MVEGSEGGSEGGGFKQPEKVSTLVPLHAIREREDVPLIAAGAIVAAEAEATGAASALDRRGSDALNRRHMCSIMTCPKPEHETCVAPSISRAKS